MKIKIKKLTNTAIIPTKATHGAAAFDLYVDDIETSLPENLDKKEFFISSKENIVIHTGIAMAIPKGYVGLIFARSGLAFKQGIRPINCVGVIDSDYRGEILVKLHKDFLLGQEADKPFSLQRGERVAQIMFVQYNDDGFEEVDDLDDTERGIGGFGSTGI